jgi:outer membrane protein OmpA-like peptidoglycan-associated protein
MIFVSKGISKDRLVAKSYGVGKPIEDNTTEEGRQKNRRTEVKILDQP